MKSERQRMIIELVKERDIPNQGALQAALEERGIAVTQATLSRDIKELALRKVQKPGLGSVYAAPRLTAEDMIRDDKAAFELLKNSIITVDHAMNTVVVKCRAGMAQAVCAKLDGMQIDDLVGTIAGDDTIFMLMRTVQDADRAAHELYSMITGQ